MAIKLKNQKRNNVRCIIYEDTGVIKRITENIEEFEENCDFDCVKVMNPNGDVRRMMLDRMSNYLKVNEDKVELQITDIDYLFNLLKELTDLDMGDLNLEENKDEIIEIFSDPSDLLREIKLEIEQITLQLFLQWYRTMKQFVELPDELIQNIKEEAKLKKLQNEVKEIEKVVDIKPKKKRKKKEEEQLNSED